MMGDVYCTADLLPGEYELESAVGAVTLSLTPASRARVDAQTSFGKVHSDIPLVRVGRSGPMGFGGERMVGSIGEGEPLVQVNLRTTHGQIRVRQAHGDARDDAPGPAHAARQTYAHEGTDQRPAHVRESAPRHDSEAVQASALEEPAQSTLAVLEALAHGEITPDEADALLYGARS